MAKDFKLPDLGEEVNEGDIVSVLVSEGDEIEAEQGVIEIETDKATLEVPCSFAGKISKVHVSEGDHVKVGDVLISLDGEGAGDKEKKNEKDEDQEEEAEDKDQEKKEAESKQEAKAQNKDKPVDEGTEKEDSKEEDAEDKEKRKAKANVKPADKESKVDGQPSKEKQGPEKPEKSKQERATQTEQRANETDKEPADLPDDVIPAGPATRRLARELGVDLQRVAAAYPDTRLTEQHVKAFVRENLGSQASVGRQAPAPPLPDFTRWGEVDRVSRTTVDKRTAERMSTAWSVAPQVTHCDTVDIGRLEDIRRRYSARAGEDAPKLAITAFLVKAAVLALRDFPKFNASLDSDTDEIVLKRYFHIGVAVDTDVGLIVPVVRDCDRKTVLEIAAELEDVAQRTRDRKIGLDELRGGTFTITNVGGIGGTVFTPILNWPEVAILGATRARRTGAFENGRIEDRLQLPLCLSFDHRVINGADAARFTARIAAALADPELMLLET